MGSNTRGTAHPGQPSYSPYYGGDPAPTLWTAPESFPAIPGAYTPPESFVIEEGTEFRHVTSTPTPHPFNPANMGLSAYLSHIRSSMYEVAKNYHIDPDSAITIIGPGAEPSDPIPQKPYEGPVPERKWWENNKYYEGPLGGAGFLGLFAPAPGSPEYEAYVAKNAEKVEKKKNNPTVSPDKTPKPSSINWSNFVMAAKAGYNLEPKAGQVGEPEDRNVFQESLDKWGAGISNIAKTPEYATYLVIGGAVLLLLLVLKR
jgi:hypothetical protein